MNMKSFLPVVWLLSFRNDDVFNNPLVFRSDRRSPLDPAADHALDIFSHAGGLNRAIIFALNCCQSVAVPISVLPMHTGGEKKP